MSALFYRKKTPVPQYPFYVGSKLTSKLQDSENVQKIVLTDGGTNLLFVFLLLTWSGFRLVCVSLRLCRNASWEVTSLYRVKRTTSPLRWGPSRMDRLDWNVLYYCKRWTFLAGTRNDCETFNRTCVQQAVRETWSISSSPSASFWYPPLDVESLNVDWKKQELRFAVLAALRGEIL